LLKEIAARANRFSVVIIAKKAQETISYTLQSLINQSRKPDEIIVVIPNTEDPTIDTVKQFMMMQQCLGTSKINIIIEGVSSHESHYSSARNIGIDASTGDIIVFIDADACAHPQWLETLDYVFSVHPDILVQQYEIIDVDDLKKYCSSENHRIPSKPIWEKRAKAKYITAMMAIKKEVLDIVGKFDPFFDVGGEDRDFLLRIEMHNIPLVFNKSAIVFHKKKSFTPIDYWRMGIPRARASIKFGLYVWKDTVAVVYHFLSLVQLLVCWLIGKLPLGLLLFMPSLLLRIRNYFKFSRDKEFRRLVGTLLCAYITYTAFVVEFLKSYFTHVLDKKSPHKWVKNNGFIKYSALFLC